MFQHLSIAEARGNVTEYRAFTSDNANVAGVDGCEVSTVVGTTTSQHFMRWSLSTDSSYQVAVMAFTAAGCNSSLVYTCVFIPTQKQGVCLFQFLCLHVYTALICRQQVVIL